MTQITRRELLTIAGLPGGTMRAIGEGRPPRLIAARFPLAQSAPFADETRLCEPWTAKWPHPAEFT